MNAAAPQGLAVNTGPTPLVLGDRPLEPADVADVAGGRPAVLGEAARHRMRTSREVLERALARGDLIYGVSTGVGAIKTVPIGADGQALFQTLLLRAHSVGHGDPAPAAFVRAAMLVRAAGLAVGVAGVRPELADALCRALDSAVSPRVHQFGSIGQADLSQMAEIGLALTGYGEHGAPLAGDGYRPIVLEPREAHAIVNSNAFSVGIACLALERTVRSLRALDVSAAVSLEALVANVDAVHPAVVAVRAYPGAVATVQRLRELLADGALLRGERRPRAMQDPLAFKVVPQTHGAVRDALAHCAAQLRVELASSGDSPIVVSDEDRAICAGNHDITPIAIALDYTRLALAQAVTIANERVQKLLDGTFTGLATGLRADPLAPHDSLGVVGHGAASLAAEARLLAQPVTLEQPTSGLAEGIEDRITMAPTGARRLHEMAGMATRLAAVELTCAAQAVDLRATTGELGAGTRTAYRATRRAVPFVGAGEAPRPDLDALEYWLASDELP